MFFPEGQIRVHLYGQPCDMRKSFDGLQALVRHELRADPCDGSLYCFISRRATQMRVLRPFGILRVGEAARGGAFYRGLVAGAHAADGLDGIEVAVGGHRAGQAAQAVFSARDAAKFSSKHFS